MAEEQEAFLKRIQRDSEKQQETILQLNASIAQLNDRIKLLERALADSHHQKNLLENFVKDYIKLQDRANGFRSFLQI